MTAQVVTSFSPVGAKVYGRRMVESFVRFWPIPVPLIVYLDAPITPPLKVVETRSTSTLTDWRACLRRWAPHPELHGKSTPTRPLRGPYKYAWDVARFAVKMFVQRDAARQLGSGILTWLDGDTVTGRAVPENFTEHLLGDADVAYLGRGKTHPETGYVGYRIPEALPLLDWCCDCYTSDRVLDLPGGWTDCHVLQAGLAAVPMRARDLTSHLYHGKSHIWPSSPLAKYLAHEKGQKHKREAIRC